MAKFMQCRFNLLLFIVIEQYFNLPLLYFFVFTTHAQTQTQTEMKY